MRYSSDEKKDYEDGMSLDTVLIYLRKILNKWWLIVISAVVVALLGFIIAKVTYVDKYYSQIMFIASMFSQQPSLPQMLQTLADIRLLRSRLRDLYP